MISSFTAVGLIALIPIYTLFKHLIRPSLSTIRGPRSPSFIFGNLLELFQRPVGEAEFAWESQYGNVVRFKSVFGEDRLLITDPKALHKIMNTSTETYRKLPNYRVLGRMVTGKGLIWADGEIHKRQKSIVLPGFGLKECKAFLPIFRDCAESLSLKWIETIGNSKGQGVVTNVVDWLSRGTLDAIGQAAFDVQFNTIQDDSHPLAKKYKNYFNDIFGLPPAEQIFIQAASKYIPVGMLEWLTDNGPGSRLTRARDVATIVTNFAKELVQEKAAALLQGKGNTDVFTLLIRANMDANAKRQLSDEELFAQMRTILVAGHETTATALSFTLLELVRNPKIQSKLRAEIRKAEATIQARGDTQFTVTDLDAMPYLNAVIKEGLRFHPIVANLMRVAGQDDVLPLSKPILTKSGGMINKVLVPKGTEIMISVLGYNRDKDLWGEDAHEFNPDRWLDGEMKDKKLPGIGVYSNLLTFYSGTHACVGWRFAVIEMQAFLSTLVGKFEFSMTDKAARIIRQPMVVMAPMVEGESDRGVQLPLAISLAPQDGEN